MKNKYNLYILLPAIILTACNQDDILTGKTSGNELIFASVVENHINGSHSRAIGDDFFVTGNTITIDLFTSSDPGTGLPFKYEYGSDRIFRGIPGFTFPLDDTYITSLTARWPSDDIRSTGLVTDQRLLADYKSADWLSGGVSTSIEGIIATDAPVPLVFQRENVLLDFELVGQNTTGLDIESLLIELQSGTSEGSRAFYAYCGNPNGHAELIMPPGSQILSPDNYLIGRIRVAGGNNDYTVIFPKTELTLQAGHRYLVTLTPQGYLMDTYVFIAGFSDADGGLAIPFAQPQPDINGNFIISNPQQLIGFSYLVRNYDDGRSFIWSERTYVIADGFTLTADDADRYQQIPAASFTGRVQNTSGQNITQIPYGNGQVLQLFN